LLELQRIFLYQRKVMLYILLVIFIQIVFESLPVSSSSHVRLLEKIFTILGVSYIPITQSFDHFLHVTTVLIIVVFFRKEWVPLINNIVFVKWFWFKKIFFMKKGISKPSRACNKLFFMSVHLLLFVCLVTCITCVFYGIIKIFLKDNFLIASDWTCLVGLIITCLSLFSLKSLNRQKNIVAGSFEFYRNALVLGFVQGCALLPGISRFAATYVVSRWLGWSSKRSFQLSFLIEFPVIVGGSLITGFLAMIQTGEIVVLKNFAVLIVLMLSVVLAYIAMFFSWKMAVNKKIWLFGFYIVIPIFLLLMVMFCS
jgi:undecaprenyl-diphosphatase